MTHHSFTVSFGIRPEIAFQEVTGLESDSGARITKITGLNKAGDVTLKRGVVGSNTAFANWLRQAKKQSVIIKQLDERGRVVATWKLANALPVKFTAPDLNAKGNDVAVEDIVIAYERLEIVR